MYILIISTLLSLNQPPIIEDPKIFSTSKKCYKELDIIYEQKIKLKANYPIEVELKLNSNNQRYLKYRFKPDYTKAEKITYYQCKKLFPLDDKI